MISNQVLKAVGVTRREVRALLKYANEHCANNWTSDLSDYIRKTEVRDHKTTLPLWAKVYKKLQYIQNHRVVSELTEADTCCGVRELSRLSRSATFRDCYMDILCHILNMMRDNCFVSFIVYYGVDRKLVANLKQVGFVQKGTFVNPNTGNTVYVLHLNLLK